MDHLPGNLSSSGGQKQMYREQVSSYPTTLNQQENNLTLNNREEQETGRKDYRNIWRDQRLLQRERNRARNRLLSIEHDVETFLRPLWKQHIQPTFRKWPLVANARAGCWYTYPLSRQECYFKSTDGHKGVWNMSLKRLNLPLIQLLTATGGCRVVDASRTKTLPDSFSRTIPVWAACINRIVAKFKKSKCDGSSTYIWDETLYTPSHLIAGQEYREVENLLTHRVESVIQSGIIFRPDQLAAQMTKPIRPLWLTLNGMDQIENHLLEWKQLAERYHLIICISCGNHGRAEKHNDSNDEDRFIYSPGAADDEESWARGVTPALFWKHHKTLFETSSCEEFEAALDRLRKRQSEHGEKESGGADELAQTGIFIGTRRTGRPPDCWEKYDAVLNVTTTEYNDMCTNLLPGKFYLQLPVEEGKRDKTALEEWLAVGIIFILVHSSAGRRVLVHCAQGRDRSVAVVLAFCVMFCYYQDESLPWISMRDEILARILKENSSPSSCAQQDATMHGKSGLDSRLVTYFLGSHGRDALLSLVQASMFVPERNTNPILLADKRRLRVMLYVIQRFRPCASPSRSTMQKLNRFFMSGSYTNRH